MDIVRHRKKGFLILVGGRKEETLLPLIEERIELESIMHSDKGSLYKNTGEKLRFKLLFLYWPEVVKYRENKQGQAREEAVD